MKTFFPILFLFSIIHIHAQVAYTPFDFESSTWSENSYHSWLSRKHYKISVEGDTIINGTSYYKLKKEGIQYFYDSSAQDEIADSSTIEKYTGAIRENDQKQIEYLYPNQTSPTIIYDFNMVTGDTIDVHDFAFSSISAVVTAMDTVEYCGTMRNRYTLQFLGQWLPFPAYITEGVGSANGILPVFELFESAANLECYSNESCNCGEAILTSTQDLIKEQNFTIYPNPINHTLSISSTSAIKINQLRIFNSFGQQILEKEINNISTNIDCNALANGSYFLVLKGNHWNHVQKFIVLH